MGKQVKLELRVRAQMAQLTDRSFASDKVVTRASMAVDSSRRILPVNWAANLYFPAGPESLIGTSTPAVVLNWA